MAVITISRQFGAGGKTMGEMLAKKIGYTFIDDELIQLVATKARVSTNWVESIEKEAGGKLINFVTSMVSKSYIERVLVEHRDIDEHRGYEVHSGYIDEQIYVDLLRQIITQLADEGNTIILGRGGQYILQDHKDAFHLLLMANKQDRIRFMEEHYDLSSSQAESIVNKEDKKRIKLYRKFGKVDYDQPDLYNLVINTSKMDLERATELVADYIKGL
jgi:cytidylate kinase